jgi:hypothetical protein
MLDTAQNLAGKSGINKLPFQRCPRVTSSVLFLMLPESNTVMRNGFEVLAEHRIFEPMAGIKVSPEK